MKTDTYSMLIRKFDEATDTGSLRDCLIELQEFERGVDSRMPAGEEIADAYMSDMFLQCAMSKGSIYVADLDGLVSLRYLVSAAAVSWTTAISNLLWCPILLFEKNVADWGLVACYSRVLKSKLVRMAHDGSNLRGSSTKALAFRSSTLILKRRSRDEKEDYEFRRLPRR